ncbi:unnamed protein product, partial [Rangifer tarandus platyrhynchus]
LEWGRRRTGGGGAAPLGSPDFRRRRGRGQRRPSEQRGDLEEAVSRRVVRRREQARGAEE